MVISNLFIISLEQLLQDYDDKLFHKTTTVMHSDRVRMPENKTIERQLMNDQFCSIDYRPRMRQLLGCIDRMRRIYCYR